MSKAENIQKQYDGYMAALQAVQSTNPGEVKVEYTHYNLLHSNEGYFVYNPSKNNVSIRAFDRTEIVSIKVDDIPDLIKALRDFFE